MTRPAGAARVPEDIEDRDPGVARERTELAWTRTAVSFGAVGAAILRSHAVVGAVVVAMSLVVWGLGQLSSRERLWSIRLPRQVRRRTVQLITGVTTLVALTALVLSFLPHATPGW